MIDMKHVTSPNVKTLITLRFDVCLFFCHRYGFKLFRTDSCVTEHISNLHGKLGWREEYKSDSPPWYVIEAYSEQINSIHISMISFQDRSAWTPSILLSTPEQTWVHTGEFRLHAPWSRAEERLSGRKLKKCVYWGFYRVTLKNIYIHLPRRCNETFQGAPWVSWQISHIGVAGFGHQSKPRSELWVQRLEGPGHDSFLLNTNAFFFFFFLAMIIKIIPKIWTQTSANNHWIT